MKNYKSIESHFIPPGVFDDIEDFKGKIVEEFYEMMNVRKGFNEEDKQFPLPIGLYVLYKDLSARRTLVFPTSSSEKKAMIMALKKQVRATNLVDGRVVCNEPIYGAFTSEIWVSSFKLPEGSDVTPEVKAKAIEEFRKQFQDGQAERETRVVVQFEDAISHKYDCRLFKILEPSIPVFLDKESEEMGKALTEMRAEGDEGGIMNSIFDYSEEQELDALGKGGMNVDYFSLREAISFVKKALNDTPTSESAA